MSDDPYAHRLTYLTAMGHEIELLPGVAEHCEYFGPSYRPAGPMARAHTHHIYRVTRDRLLPHVKSELDAANQRIQRGHYYTKSGEPSLVLDVAYDLVTNQVSVLFVGQQTQLWLEPLLDDHTFLVAAALGKDPETGVTFEGPLP